MHQNEPINSPVGHRLPGYMDYQGIGARPQYPVERKWALGLQVKLSLVLAFRRKFYGFLFEKHPVDSMGVVNNMQQ